jgi:hypothetical protein
MLYDGYVQWTSGCADPEMVKRQAKGRVKRRAKMCVKHREKPAQLKMPVYGGAGQALGIFSAGMEIFSDLFKCRKP